MENVLGRRSNSTSELIKLGSVPGWKISPAIRKQEKLEKSKSVFNGVKVCLHQYTKPNRPRELAIFFHLLSTKRMIVSLLISSVSYMRNRIRFWQNLATSSGLDKTGSRVLQ